MIRLYLVLQITKFFDLKSRFRKTKQGPAPPFPPFASDVRCGVPFSTSRSAKGRGSFRSPDLLTTRALVMCTVIGFFSLYKCPVLLKKNVQLPLDLASTCRKATYWTDWSCLLLSLWIFSWILVWLRGFRGVLGYQLGPWFASWCSEVLPFSLSFFPFPDLHVVTMFAIAMIFLKKL